MITINIRFACLAMLLTMMMPHPGIADSLWPAAVKRATNDRDADLLAELVRLGRYQDAAKICQSKLAAVTPQSDDSALWTIRLSETLAAAQMTKGVFDEPQIALAQKPVTDLLAAYPRHPRHLFLEAQLVSVERDAARHEVITVAVSPRTDDRIDRAMKRLLRTTATILELAGRVGDAHAQLNNQRGTREFALISDLVRLQQQLQIDAVSLSLMQTELFPPGSQDQFGAASKAEATAEQAATKLPADSAARREVERLRIEAIARGEQFEAPSPN